MSLLPKFIRVVTLYVGLALACCRPASAAMVEYTTGHSDIGLAYDSLEGLFLHYHFGVGSAILDGLPATAANEELAPSEAYVRVADSTMITVPSSVPFLGVNANDPVWLLSQSNTSGQPFVGLAAEELQPTDFTSAGFRLTDFVGPAGGNFALFGQSGFTTNVFMRSNDGVNPVFDLFNVSIGGHDHASWGFTKEGVYDLTIQGFASGPAGSFTDTGTFRFVVGSLTAVPEPSSLVLVLLGASASAWRRKRDRAT